MIQLGMIYMLPLFFGRWAENGLWVAIKEFVVQLLSLKFLFGLFEMRTSMYYLDRGLRLGQAMRPHARARHAHAHAHVYIYEG